MAPKPKILALDLDGTLCEYDGWKGPAHFGKPFPEVVAELHKLKEGAEPWAIVIFTTRRTDYALKAHLDRYDVPYDYINKHPWQPPGSSHKITADVYLDDRALRYNGVANGLAARIRAAAESWTEKKAMVDEEDHQAVAFAQRLNMSRTIINGGTDGREEE